MKTFAYPDYLKVGHISSKLYSNFKTKIRITKNIEDATTFNILHTEYLADTTLQTHNSVSREGGGRNTLERNCIN